MIDCNSEEYKEAVAKLDVEIRELRKRNPDLGLDMVLTISTKGDVLIFSDPPAKLAKEGLKHCFKWPRC